MKKVSTAAAHGWQIEAEVQLEGKIVSISKSIDKKELLCGTESGKIYRVLTTDLSYMRIIDAHTSSVSDICFAPMVNEKFSTIDESGILKLWDTGEYSSEFSIMSDSRAGGSCVCLDEHLCSISGWSDGFIRCFDPQGNLLWHIASAHRGGVTSIYADENYILSGGDDGQVRVWARQTHQLLLQLSGN